MGQFVSYSSQDRSAIEPLTTAPRRARQQVWFDEDLGGGEAWWNEILEQIRSCAVFIVALSNRSLECAPPKIVQRRTQAVAEGRVSQRYCARVPCGHRGRGVRYQHHQRRRPGRRPDSRQGDTITAADRRGRYAEQFHTGCRRRCLKSQTGSHDL
jgi:TIR domain